MKTGVILLSAMLASAPAYSQPGMEYQNNIRHRHRNMTDLNVQRLDSVVGYTRETVTGTDVPDYVFIYKYDRKSDDFTEVIKLNLPERTNSNRQLYTYTSDGFRTSYLYQEWDGSTWQDKMLTRYFENDAGILGTEVFSKPDASGQWVEYQQHFYEYDQEGRIALYLRQMRNSDGTWYDFSENIWTFNDDDQLLGRIEKRTADDYIIWTETYNYGDGTKPVERIRQTMRFNPVLRYNTLTNDTRNLYYYDDFNDPSIVELYRWQNNSWVYAGKSMYYYSFIPGRKVTICHNGHTLSIAPQALPAHLAHGDKLGYCTDEEDQGQCYSSSNKKENASSVTVFPNPADTYFEVRLQPGHNFRSATLFSGDGRVLKSKNVFNLEQTSFDISGLKSGNYLLKLSGQGCADEVVVIMK
jgi:hypothetical protein